MDLNCTSGYLQGDNQSASTQALVSPVNLTCTSQSGGHVVAPVFTGCQIDGPLNLSINVNSSDAETITASQALPVHLANLQPVLQVTRTKQELSEYIQGLKSKLRERFSHVFEGQNKQRNSKLLNQIYTELYVTEGGSGQVNTEHEVWQIEKATRMEAMQDIPIKCKDIFQPILGQVRPSRIVITIGVAGIGKTVSVQKFILDWAEGQANQEFQFIFPLPFRQLNLMKKPQALTQLLDDLFIERRGLEISSSNKVLFVFDGLDECRLPLDFQNNESCFDIKESISVDALLTNLIMGNLLPFACLWITSRPAAVNQIPSEWIDLLTEVRGFNNPQKEEYFRKRVNNEELANKIITHVKSSRSLYIMCHIPVFCWMITSVLETKLRKTLTEELPKSLTQMYTCFLALHEKNLNLNLSGRRESDVFVTGKNILSLGRLAFRQLEKGNLIFYEEDLQENEIDVNQASVFSGVYTEIFSEEMTLCQRKLFCFVHLSVQEFLAALYVFIKFNNDNENLMSKRPSFSRLVRDSPATRFYKAAVDKAMQSENGHLDLFLRFLLGFSLESNHAHLGNLLTQRKTSPQTRAEVVKYIKQKIRLSSSPERCINLFHCLNEINDHSLVEEIQRYLSAGHLSDAKLSPAQWSALVFVLLTSEEDLRVFDLKKYASTEDGLLRLLPVVKASHAALLKGCKLTMTCCKVMAPILSSTPLKELDLSDNCLEDTGVELLSAELQSPHCKLETLRLQSCSLTEKSCEVLAAVLSLDSSHLKELDLSDNELQDSGVKLLSAGLGSPLCKLYTLKLSFCRVTEVGCAYLASALNSNPHHLRELDLSYNHPGVRMLSAMHDEPRCRLEKLNLNGCAEFRNKPGPERYACELTLDPNTAHKDLFQTKGNKKVTRGAKRPYPDHPDRFDFWRQVLCREGLTGRCYWEVEWTGRVTVGLAYRRMGRKGEGCDSRLGQNEASWSLSCSNDKYIACHNKKIIAITITADSNRVGVYLDSPAERLSFYMVSLDKLTHLHTFHSTFTEQLYPGFRLGWVNSTVTMFQAE